MFVAARGGAGGHGNAFFLSNEHRAPTFAEEGAKGEQITYIVELRTMAQVGLVRLLYILEQFSLERNRF